MSLYIGLSLVAAGGCGGADDTGVPLAPDAIRYRLTKGSSIAATAEMGPEESLAGIFDIVPGATGIPRNTITYTFDQVEWHSRGFSVEQRPPGGNFTGRISTPTLRVGVHVIINGENGHVSGGTGSRYLAESPPVIEGLELVGSGYRIVIYAKRVDQP